MLQACDKLCRKKKDRRNHGDTWWWNKEVKEAIQQKKVADKKMHKNRLEENKARYNIKNRTKKVVANSRRKKAKKINKIEQKTK